MSDFIKYYFSNKKLYFFKLAMNLIFFTGEHIIFIFIITRNIN